MPGPGPDVDIALNARAIEWLEAELIHQAGALFHALVKNNEDAATDGLAAVIISAYLLSRRLGYGFARLDTKIRAQLQTSLEQEHELEQWFGDISELTQHTQGR